MHHPAQTPPDPFRARAESWDPDTVEHPWRPAPGDMIVGTVVDRDDGRSTEYGSCTVLVVIDEDSGREVAVWALHEVLRQEVARQDPCIGERIAIKRMADVLAEDGTVAYRHFKMAVDRRPRPTPTRTKEESDAGAERTTP